MDWQKKVYKAAEPRRMFNGKTWLRERDAVMKRDHYKCRGCGQAENLSVHHIKPRSKGGSNLRRNLETLCEDCHNKAEVGEEVYQTPVSEPKGRRWQEWVYGGASHPGY